jgi:hypothetical protein
MLNERPRRYLTLRQLSTTRRAEVLHLLQKLTYAVNGRARCLLSAVTFRRWQNDPCHIWTHTSISPEAYLKAARSYLDSANAIRAQLRRMLARTHPTSPANPTHNTNPTTRKARP